MITLPPIIIASILIPIFMWSIMGLFMYLEARDIKKEHEE